MEKRHTPRWILAGWIAIAVVAAIRLTPVANASHSHTGWDQRHISTIHTASSGTTPGSQDEEYCVVSFTSSLSASTFAPFLQETLTGLDFSIIWDGTGDWKIDLWRKAKWCNQYTTAERDTIEIEYRIADSWSECGAGFSCVVSVAPVQDSSGQHQHYRWMNSLLKTSHVSGLDTRARAFINHESGHLFGLRDPEYNGDCMHSVMHNFLYSQLGCTDPVWYPTSSDFTSVKSIMSRTN